MLRLREGKYCDASLITIEAIDSMKKSGERHMIM